MPQGSVFGRVPQSPSFFVWKSLRPFGNFATADFHHIWSRNVARYPVVESVKTFRKLFFKGHLPPESEIENRSNGHLTQSRLQVTGCTADRYRVHRVVVHGPGSFRGQSTFIYHVRLRSNRASKLPNFRILAYLPYTKSLKRTFR